MNPATYQLSSKYDPPNPPDEPIIEDDDELLSTCCGSNAYGEIHPVYTDDEDGNSIVEYSGICNNCRDHATFTDGSED
jgi:hypothetical protein